MRSRKKILNKPNYPKQYAELSTTNLTKTCIIEGFPMTDSFSCRPFLVPAQYLC